MSNTLQFQNSHQKFERVPVRLMRCPILQFWLHVVAESTVNLAKLWNLEKDDVIVFH